MLKYSNYSYEIEETINNPQYGKNLWVMADPEFVGNLRILSSVPNRISDVISNGEGSIDY